MVINNIRLLFLLMLIICSKASGAAEKILVERYMQWQHPILKVFKKYGIIPYKVIYSRDGTCPTFYARFKFSPDTRAPNATAFHKVYYEALIANSYFPYALVDKEDDMRINVGWVDKAKTTMTVEMDKSNSASLCKKGE